jgi:hypothetical protein
MANLVTLTQGECALSTLGWHMSLGWQGGPKVAQPMRPATHLLASAHKLLKKRWLHEPW